MKLRKYNVGGALNNPPSTAKAVANAMGSDVPPMTTGDPKGPKKSGDPKADWIGRATSIADTGDFPLGNLAGLDYEKMQDMTDEEMKGLLGMIKTFEMPRDEEGKLKLLEFKEQLGERLPEIKETLKGLTDNYGLDTEALLESILDNAKDYKGEPLGWGAKKSAKAAAWASDLYADGGVLRLRKTKH
jgi:hypothetical protein